VSTQSTVNFVIIKQLTVTGKTSVYSRLINVAHFNAKKATSVTFFI